MRTLTGFENSLAQWTKPGGCEKRAYIGIKGRHLRAVQSVLDGVRHHDTDILPCLGREVRRMRGNRFEYGLDLRCGKRRDGLVAECGSQVLAHDKLRLPVGFVRPYSVVDSGAVRFCCRLTSMVQHPDCV